MPEVLLPWLAIETDTNETVEHHIQVTITSTHPRRVEVQLPFLGSDYRNISLGSGDILPWLSLV